MTDTDSHVAWNYGQAPCTRLFSANVLGSTDHGHGLAVGHSDSVLVSEPAPGPGRYADWLVPGEVRIRRSTIATNGDGVNCPSGVALWHDGNGGVRASLDSTIVADNIGPCAFPDLANNGGGTAAFITSRGFNLVENGNTALIRSRTTDLFGTDPMLDPLQDNGGPTETHALLPASPAIGAVGTRCGFADQRGVTRLPPPCDTGAVEFP